MSNRKEKSCQSHITLDGKVVGREFLQTAVDGKVVGRDFSQSPSLFYSNKI